jgi:hypothetical protein
MGHYITVDYDYWFIAYDDNNANLVSGEGLAGTRIDTARTYLELFQTEADWEQRLSELTP